MKHLGTRQNDFIYGGGSTTVYWYLYCFMGTPLVDTTADDQGWFRLADASAPLVLLGRRGRLHSVRESMLEGCEGLV